MPTDNELESISAFLSIEPALAPVDYRRARKGRELFCMGSPAGWCRGIVGWWQACVCRVVCRVSLHLHHNNLLPGHSIL